MKELNELIKACRERLGLSKTEMAHKLRISYIYYSQLEKPFKKGALPSTSLLKRIASLTAKGDKAVEESLFKDLVKAKLTYKVPKVFSELIDTVDVEFSNSMPEGFVERLSRDIENIGGLTRVFEKTGIPEEILKAVLNKRYALNRELVIQLARAMGQPVEEYLLLAEYLPKGEADFSSKRMLAFFRLLRKLPPSTANKLIDTLTELLAFPEDFEK